ncbi:hypothetical protein PhCBS80983_g02810 [Powellomyces hirtus]|uniref:Spindle assembly abnormal protein 6 N-terminal domain-containing protein n=1 Tax=Powellomyces hirtus TaxID=109895 RepID=A0A507E554_9FUNG|nr:hypothetical protein PhCBS80983_g02810 [Powellomyces hirtus]
METATEILFNKGIPVTVKQPSVRLPQVGPRITIPGLVSAATDTYQEKRRPNITVQVGLASRKGGRLKVLEVQLTDEADPFFLYHLEVGEDDFHTLKDEQNLLVDFQQFPVNFIELLEACHPTSRDSQPKFIAQLTTESTTDHAVFQVVETNRFRNITHISLQFIPGNDLAVKQYLAHLVKDFKAENAALKNQLDTTGTSLAGRLKDSEQLAANLSAELERTRLANAEHISRLQLQNAEESAREREGLIRQREDERLTFEREKRSIEIRCDEKVKSLSQELASLNSAHSHMLSHAQNLEIAQSNANKQLDALRRDLTIATQDLEKETQKNEDLSRVNNDLKAECHSLRDNLKLLERDGSDKLAGGKRLEEMLQNANDQKAAIEEALEAHKSKNARLEEGLKRATEEINKGNEIIRRLQTELKSSKAKLKLKNVVTLQQEKLLDEKIAGVQAQQKEASDLRETLATVRSDLQTANARVEQLTKELQEGKAIIEDNNHVIEWLHKQMNEDALTRPLPIYSASTAYRATETDRQPVKTVSEDSTQKRTSPTGYRSRYLSGMVGHAGSTTGSRPPYQYGQGGSEGYKSGATSRIPSPSKFVGHQPTIERGLGSAMGGLVGKAGIKTANPLSGKSNYF